MNIFKSRVCGTDDDTERSDEGRRTDTGNRRGDKRLDGAGVSDVADKLSFPKSKVHNYRKTLKGSKYLVNENGIY